MQELQETQVHSLSWEDALKEEMATHLSILAWEIDRGAWWAAVHGVTESDTTEHIRIMRPCKCVIGNRF